MYQSVPPYPDPVPPSTNQYRTQTAPGQLKTGNVAWGLQTSAQFAPGLVYMSSNVMIMVELHLSPVHCQVEGEKA